MKTIPRIVIILTGIAGLAVSGLLLSAKPDAKERLAISDLVNRAREASRKSDTEELRRLSLFTTHLDDRMVLEFFDFLRTTEISATQKMKISKSKPYSYWIEFPAYPVSHRILKSDGAYFFQGDIVTIEY